MLQKIELLRQIHGGSIRFPEHRRNVSGSTMGTSRDHREIAVGDLVFLLVAAFRRHPHIRAFPGKIESGGIFLLARI